MQHDDAAIILANADFFEICNDDERRMLAFASERKRYAAGTIIAKSGEVPEGPLILISGTVSVTPDGAGEPNPYVVSQAGTLVGSSALVLAKPRPMTVTAVTIVEMLFVPRRAFLKLANQSPELARRAAARVRADLSSYLDVLRPIRTLLDEK